MLHVDKTFRDFEDYWSPFLSDVSVASSYAAQLSDADRKKLKECLRRKILGSQPDGAFVLPSRAWAIRGTLPGS